MLAYFYCYYNSKNNNMPCNHNNKAFLDSTSYIINLCGVMLGTLRFRESWYILLLMNNCMDPSIWTINVIRCTPNAEMSLVTAIMYLVMNIIGVVSWIRPECRQKQTR